MNAAGIEGSYPLSPMQQGMLFHALYAPESDIYFGQAHWPMCGVVDIPTFHAAWQDVVDRHSILRTGFDSGGPDGPLQVVHRYARVPLEVEDWRAISTKEQDARLAAFLQTDRARGFDLDSVPLLRITVIRLGEEEWRVVWSGHHLLVDGRSMALVLREVLALYEARLACTSARLPAPTPYADYIAWLQKQDLSAAQAFWRRTLAGFTAATSFDMRCGAGRAAGTVAADRLHIRITPTLERQLRTLARISGTTLNVVIMGAWAILLSRYSRERDVVFGLTIGSGGKGAPLDRSLVGLVINTLPLRVPVESAETFPDFLRSLRARLLEVQHHAYTPLPDIVRWSDLPAATPLFDNIVVFDNSSIDRLATTHGRLRIGHLEIIQQSNYPLNLVVQRGAGLQLGFLYHRQRFAEEEIAHLAGQLEHLLEEMAQAPDSRLGELSATPDAEQRLLHRWNSTDAPYPRDRCLHHLFEAQAERMPEALAVAGEQEQLTYGELDRRTHALAQLLRARHVGPEVVVGLAAERSPDLVVGMVGITKAGGACLLLDPHNPPERTAFMLAESGARLVLTHRRLRDALPSGPEILYLDGDLSGQTSENAPAMGITPQSLAYVVYTSGTTGQPKGVMIEHHSAVNLVQWHLDTFEVSPADRATQIAGPAFDAVVWEIWPVLAGGASLHIPPHDVRGTPRRLQDWLLAEGITISFLPTPLAESMLALPWPATTDLRTLLVGGDVLHAAPQKTLPFRVINNYGPSECTVVATSGAVTTAAVEERPPSIGRPIANMQVHLLDDQLQPVPIGVTGELYIGGAGVARGYLGRPELTEERFLPNPLSLQPGDHLYRTGDLARYRPNGEIEYVGRTDRQVKLRGYRIELGEIESALMRHEAVREAAAVVDEDGPGEKRLMAYIVSQGPPAPAAADLRSFLRRQLPEYMVPAGIVSLQALPITTNGKVNRSALPAHVKEGANREDGSPRTATEALLSSIWAEALGVSSVGIRDNFFDLGGDSLLSIELIERIRLRLRHELAISDLFRAPTVEELARLLEGAPLLQAEPLVPIQPLGALQPFYCVAPVLGTVFPYYKLAQLLGTDRPFYGLQPIGLDAPGTSFTIESLAAHYLAAIRRAQPHGPYSIGGWSFGGIVAFEMARQLHSASEDVSSLVILDTPAPGIHARARLNASVRFLLTMTHGLGGYVKDYEYLAAVTSGRPVVRRLVARLSTTPSAAPPFRPLRSALQRVAIAGVVPPQSRLALYHLPTIREMARSFLMGAAAAVRYRPGVYEGSISLLSAEHGSAGQERGATLGWDELANAKVRVYPVPGNHMTLLREPHIDTVAAALSSALEETLETPQLTAVDVETGVI